MGCDIHMGFEERQDDGSWRAIWPRLAESWLDQFYEQHRHNIELLIPPAKDEDVSIAANEDDIGSYRRLTLRIKEYFSTVPLAEMREKYAHMKHGFFCDVDYPGDDNVDYPRRIRTRDYSWFATLAEVRGSHEHSFKERGLPDDCTWEVRSAHDVWKEDHHTPSWLMVSELLTPRLIEMHPGKAANLQRVFPEPEKIRMVFWFDN